MKNSTPSTFFAYLEITPCGEKFVISYGEAKVIVGASKANWSYIEKKCGELGVEPPRVPNGSFNSWPENSELTLV